MIQIDRFTTPRTTRVARIGEPDDSVSEVLFALHGWGQLAADFAEVLVPLAAPGRLIVCPEALSKFYINFQERATGSSWMTSYDREFEILDYVTYLDGVLDSFREDLADDVDIRVLAFSQGCHTASRWVGNGSVSPSRLVLWGSDPAEDLTDEEWTELAKIGQITVVAGTLDRFVTGGRLARAEKALSSHDCRFDIIRYEGGHHLQQSVLADLFEASETSQEDEAVDQADDDDDAGAET